MPLIIEGGRVPPRWAERKSCRLAGSGESYSAGTDCVRIAFLNNMPDAALEDTEIQFFELLEAASGEIPVRLKLHSLSGVPRGERGEQHLNSFYFSTQDLLNTRFDAVIMTGTEPRQANLRNEPYWSALGECSGLGRKQHCVDDLVMPGGARGSAAQRWHQPSSVE